MLSSVWYIRLVLSGNAERWISSTIYRASSQGSLILSVVVSHKPWAVSKQATLVRLSSANACYKLPFPFAWSYSQRTSATARSKRRMHWELKCGMPWYLVKYCHPRKNESCFIRIRGEFSSGDIMRLLTLSERAGSVETVLKLLCMECHWTLHRMSSV